jgi:uridine kinase
MHDEFVEPSKYNADLILHSYDEDQGISIKRMETAMRVICNHLKMETLGTR